MSEAAATRQLEGRAAFWPGMAEPTAKPHETARRC